MRYDGTTMVLRYDITTQSTAWHPMCMPPYLHDAYMCMLPTHVHAHDNMCMCMCMHMCTMPAGVSVVAAPPPPRPLEGRRPG
eukprot:scaffold21829_cov18-Phaeocystis_antarctica.AAC.1